MSNAQLDPDHVASAQHLWYGHRKLRTRSELELCWKAAKAIAAGDGVLSEEERVALVGRMVATAVPAAVVESVMNWDVHNETPADLVAQFRLSTETRLELGLWMVYEGLSIGFADGTLGPGEVDSVHDVAATMGVPATTVDALIALCRDEALVRMRRIKTLQGRIAVASNQQDSPLAYELVPETVRGEALKCAV
jgi:hypothetical protein